MESGRFPLRSGDERMVGTGLVADIAFSASGDGPLAPVADDAGNFYVTFPALSRFDVGTSRWSAMEAFPDADAFLFQLAPDHSGRVLGLALDSLNQWISSRYDPALGHWSAPLILPDAQSSQLPRYMLPRPFSLDYLGNGSEACGSPGLCVDANGNALLLLRSTGFPYSVEALSFDATSNQWRQLGTVGTGVGFSLGMVVPIWQRGCRVGNGRPRLGLHQTYVTEMPAWALRKISSIPRTLPSCGIRLPCFTMKPTRRPSFGVPKHSFLPLPLYYPGIIGGRCTEGAVNSVWLALACTHGPRSLVQRSRYCVDGFGSRRRRLGEGGRAPPRAAPTDQRAHQSLQSARGPPTRDTPCDGFFCPTARRGDVFKNGHGGRWRSRFQIRLRRSGDDRTAA